MGRPRVYLEPRKALNFLMPESLYDHYEALALSTRRNVLATLCDVLAESRDLNLTGLREGKSITNPPKENS
jgi:hypothetical protein